jgi:hypothetical protein
MREVLKDVNTPSAKQQPASRAKPAPVAAPVTAHRLFPAIVALWFAALLGIGSLVIAPEALSAVVSALGIPKLVHAASPPLGFTARALLALAMAGVGVVVGLIIGSRIAARHKVQPQRKTDPTKGRQVKPTHAYSYDPAEHAAEAEPDIGQQRGPLRASVAFADIEPLTDGPEPALQADCEAIASPSDDHFAVLGAPKAEPVPSDDETVYDHFDALLANSEQPEAIAEFATPAPFTTLVEADEAPVFESDHAGRITRDPVELQTFQPHAETEAEPAIEPEVATSPVAHDAMEPGSADLDIRRTLSEAPLAQLGTVQLVERLALAMAAAAEARNAPVHVEALLVLPHAPAPEADGPTAHSEEPFELEECFDQASHREVAPRFVAPVIDSEPQPANAASEPWSAPDFAEFAALNDPAPQFQASRPSILDPIAQAWDEESVEDDDAPTIAPPRFLSASASDARQPAFARDNRPLFGGRQSPPSPATAKNTADQVDDNASDDADEDRYPSLLDIQPSPREAIRIAAPEAQQAEPIVMFPNAGPNGGQRADAPFAPPPASTLQSRRGLQFQAPGGAGPMGAGSGAAVMPPELPADPVDAEEADRALRAALATLQRMSGGR